MMLSEGYLCNVGIYTTTLHQTTSVNTPTKTPKPPTSQLCSSPYFDYEQQHDAAQRLSMR
jgi:hypothetical protein